MPIAQPKQDVELPVFGRAYESRFVRIDPERGRFQVHRRAFADPQVFAEEKRRVLMRSWVFLGHGSEIPRPNDFLVRKVLDRQIIFVRDRAGGVRALLNTCPHRGAMLCRERVGNRKTFTCGYHGWTFRNSGELLDRNASCGYSERHNEDGIYNLHAVPRIEGRGEFYFVNFDPAAEPLVDYLDGAADTIDLLAGYSKQGLEVIQGCHEYSIRANYKLLCENSFDGYHLSTTHASYVDLITAQHKGEMVPPVGSAYSLGHGHGCLEMNVGAGRPIAQWLPIWGEEARREIEAKKAELVTRYGAERSEVIANFNRMMVIFPNTVINDQHAIQVRSIIPVAHDQMIVRAWVLGPVDESPLLRRIRVQNAVSFLGPGGFGTPDDAEMLEQAQAGYQMGGIEWNDVSKGFTPQENAQRGTGPWDGEIQMRSFWLQYDRMMDGPG